MKGTVPYEEVFELNAPARCRILGFRKKHVLQQQVTMKGIPLLQGGTSDFIDRVNTTSQSADGRLTVSRQWPLHVTGWAVDGPNGMAAGGVYIEIDGRVFQAAYGIARPDVAAALQNPRYALAGFDAEIPIGDLAPGRQFLALRVLNNLRTGYYEGKTIEISVE